MVGRYIALVTLLALGVAFYAQFVLLMVPCELCLWERWPYRVLAMLGVTVALLPPRFARLVLWLCVLAALTGMGISFLHIGVEQGWWASPLPACNGVLTPGAPLPAIPAKPCDQPVYLINVLPISMALMDFCLMLAFAVAIPAYLLSSKGKLS